MSITLRLVALASAFVPRRLALPMCDVARYLAYECRKRNIS